MTAPPPTAAPDAPADFGAELARKKFVSITGVFSVILGLALLVFAALMIVACNDPLVRPNHRVLCAILAGFSSIAGFACIVIAFRTQYTWILRERGAMKQMRKSTVALPYDRIDSVTHSRTRRHHHGSYLGTVVSARFTPERSIGIKPFAIAMTVKDVKIKTGFLAFRYEITRCGVDDAAEIAATYIAPKILDKIEAGETVKCGHQLSLDAKGITQTPLFKSTFIPWAHCAAIGTDEKERPCIFRPDGEVMVLLIPASTQNFGVLQYLIAALGASSSAHAPLAAT